MSAVAWRVRMPERGTDCPGSSTAIVGINYAPEPSGIAPYSTAMARHLARDHDVAVLTGLPHYPAWEVPTNYRRLQFEEELDGVRVIRCAHFVPPRHSALLRTLHEGTFLLSGLAASMRVRGQS